MKTYNTFLVEVYLDWRNNYLTTEKFAEHNRLTKGQAERLIRLGYDVWRKNNAEPI